jgi:hypothetical protein
VTFEPAAGYCCRVWSIRSGVLLAVVLSAALLAGCGSGAPAGTTAPAAPKITAGYRTRIRRITKQRCHGLGLKSLAATLRVPARVAVAADAYAKTWPVSVRADARSGCLAGLRAAP